ncbi:MAG: SUMF1/EgtB/PvdO family nonheme iron enzyme [Bacteroidales bacterium]|nr:SUMF1/EgtB/PvdO family nonheme iron enzyme [Bacteroidales bacterium]
MVFIEGGTFTMGATEETPFPEWDNQPRQVTVNSFYMDQTEVRNLDYLEYIHWLEKVYGTDYPGVVKKALPDTTVWRNKLAYNEPLVETYFRHPAYHDYPVVGVSWVQANAYASWRTDRVNEMLLIKAGYLSYNQHQKDSNSFSTEAYLAGRYKSPVVNEKGLFKKKGDTTSQRIGFGDGILLPRYRLPTEAEWEYAALGLVGNTISNRVVSRKIYPWAGTSLRNDKKDDIGRFMANFKIGSGDYMGIAGSTNDGASIPAPVMSYWPNDYGLYNMAGNVSEWVLDVYRPLSFQEESDFDPYRGSNKNGNNANAKDGDYQSTIQANWNNPSQSDLKNSTKLMYDYGVTTLINDKSRVIKGGSWADPPYYLSPGTRRFMNEDSSSATVGFRCAMTRVGSPISDKKYKK